MKKPFLVLAAVATAAFVFITGCETEKLSDTQLSISPSSATVAPGKSVTLTASGGWDYTWKVNGPGSLSTYNGKKVTYTASGVTFTPSSSSSTNTSHRIGFAKAEGASTETATATLEVKSGDMTATATITIKGE